MKTFGDTRIDLQLDEQRRRETIIHNEKVNKNRDILKRLIHCVIFLGKQELPFRGHDESRESANRGNYLELLTFIAEYDPDLHYHLSTSKVFIGTSSQIQNDLISAVAEVMGETIKEEISKAPFVALMLDETTDVSNAAQLSFVLRFVTDSGVKERFVKFEDVTGKKRAEDVAAMALGFLEEHGCMGKLVAQCYDGAAVMASGLNGVQAKVKEKIPQALFIHCYAHALNLVLSQGVVKIKECRIFFSHLSGLAAFFSRSPKRTQLLDEICQKRLPRVAPTRWNFASRLVCTLFEKKDALKDLFDYIVEHHEEFDDAAILSADGYLSNLGNFEFGFFLSTFNEIFAHSDVLFDILQNKSFDMQFCLTRVEEFCICIEGQRDRFDQIYDETVQDTGLPTGRRAHGDSRSHYKKLHNGILENILNQVQNRFKDHEKLSFLSLLDPQQFTSFHSNFPETAFASLTESYGPHFDLSRLKTELSVMYASDKLNISIHSFPTDVKRQRTWEKNVQNTRAKWSVKNPRTTYICSAHFLPDDFEEGPILMVGNTGDFATATPAAKRHRSAYFEKREKTQAEGRDLVLGGDGRADSPGHCAKFGSYTMLELHANVVIDVQLVQSNECGGSYHMEKTGLERSLAHLERQGLAVGTMVTDRHRQIAKWLRETYPHIEHLYDIWHVAKGFSKKLLAASNERECQVLRPWIKSVSNHMYWCAVSTPSGQGAQIVAKWESVVSHVQNVHTGHGDLFPSCIHGRLEGRESHKKWLEPCEWFFPQM
ncbi:hypothetical protein JOQ06_012686 [Pogonophryne albipinna]|uniref:THAP-type domain-containing protein n=1 Tax=Pogonophryne albipinna TaxID=1090488 RepID=A0AAD6BHJ3_9TELE|nr:hypothetical protein JOQ06_012686 [Pogonophryne albipinna]